MAGDFRVTVFDVAKLREARAKRDKRGAGPLPFDAADGGPWEKPEPEARAAAQPPDGPGGASNGRAGTEDAEQGVHPRDEKRLVAGKEDGCLFFFLAHSNFLALECEDTPGTPKGGSAPGTPTGGRERGSGGESGGRRFRVPLKMMDKAAKNKRGLYSSHGVATLGYAPP